VYAFAAAFDVKETKESYIFKADVPGIKEQDLDISITGDRLTISGKRETEELDKDETYYTFERSYGSFSRSFTLPVGANPEPVKVELKEGVLTLVFPKRPEVLAKKIPIKAGERVRA
jgi:HSP20 family protein